MLIKALLIPASLTALLSACGTPDETTSQVAAAGPDLRFASANVDMALPGGGALVPVAQGSTFTIPCNTSGFRGRYRYGNSGNVGAGAHTNRSHTAGSGAYSFAQAALGAGLARMAWASFPAVPAANTPTIIAIRLDSTLAIAESVETNNAWWAKVVRQCP